MVSHFTSIFFSSDFSWVLVIRVSIRLLFWCGSLRQSLCKVLRFSSLSVSSSSLYLSLSFLIPFLPDLSFSLEPNPKKGKRQKLTSPFQ